MEVEEVDHLVGGGRSPWIVIGIVALLLGGGVAAFLLWPSSLDPEVHGHRVALGVIAPTDAAAEAYADAVRRRLSGFEVVDGTPRSLEEALALAEEQRAMHVVVLEVETIAERAPEGLDPAFFHGRLGATARQVEGETTETTSFEVVGTGADADEAAEAAIRRGARAVASAVAEALVTSEAVQAFAGAADTRYELNEARESVGHVVEAAEAAAEARERFERHCAEGTTALGRDVAGHDGGCLSGGCDEHYAFGMLPDGSATVVHTETPAVAFDVGDATAIPQRVEVAEHIEVMPLEGGERRVIGTATNYYTYPSLSPDGRTVVAIEDWRSGFGMVAIDVASGERRLLQAFTGYPQSPAIAPDGREVLVRHRVRRRGDPTAVIAPLAEDAPPQRRIGTAQLVEWVSVRLAPGADETVALVEPMPLDAVLPPGQPVRDEMADAREEDLLPRLFMEERLAVLDRGDGHVLAWLDDDRHRPDTVLGSHDGAVVFTWENRGRCGVAWWRPDGEDDDAVERLRAVETEACVMQPRLASDGAVVGVARVALSADVSPADVEVVRLDPETGEVAILTANDLRERYPRAAGEHVVFDRVGARTYRSFPRIATCWVDARP